jgi:AbrB family looped-hinge helix DNA binding protein
MISFMKVTVKGQVTIPQSIRDYLGITIHSEVDFVRHGDRVVLVAKGELGGASKFAKSVGVLRSKWTTAGLMKMTRE